MVDPRHQKLAQALIGYSINIQPGEKLRIVAPPVATPLVRELYREALRAGGLPSVRLVLEDLTEILVREGSEEQLCYLPESDVFEAEHYDARISIWSEENTKAFAGLDPTRMALYQQGRLPLMERIMDRTARNELRWCGTVFPTQAHAQDAGMSLNDYEDFVFGAGLLDQDDPAEGWRKVQAEQEHIVDFLNGRDEIHIVAPGTDLTYRVGGRLWISSHGAHNFPDGEVFTGPIENSATGTVRFTYPAVYNGNEVEDVRLTFSDGKVIDATAARGEHFLISMLDMDPGARYLGEVAFGLNYGIKEFTRNILFDEKIGGTMHMALGKSYPETGGKNQSALHWDMISDLREGRVYADGQLCYESGRFLI